MLRSEGHVRPATALCIISSFAIVLNYLFSHVIDNPKRAQSSTMIVWCLWCTSLSRRGQTSRLVVRAYLDQQAVSEFNSHRDNLHLYQYLHGSDRLFAHALCMLSGIRIIWHAIRNNPLVVRSVGKVRAHAHAWI